MSPPGFLPIFLLLVLASQMGIAQEPLTDSEAARVGLHGPVHTVLSEQFDYAGGKAAGSTITIYDPQGYELEEFRYETDGSLHSHVKLTRKTWQILKIESSSVVPEENQTVIHTFDSNGVITQTEIHDRNGAVTRTTNELVPRVGNVTGSGRLLSKDTTEYRNDNYGNWIEQKESQWHAASGAKPAQSTFVSVHTRTITYY